MPRLRFPLLMLACCVAIAACSGAGTVTPSPSLVVSLPSGGDYLSLAVGSSSSVSVTENGHTGTVTARSSDLAVAAVNAQGTTSTFLIRGIAPGTAVITFTGGNGAGSSVYVLVAASPTPAPSAAPTAAPTSSPAPAALTLSPASLSFLATGSASAHGVTATEAGYAGAITATTPASGHANSCASIASISPSSGASGAAFTVTPLAAGSCSYTFTGAQTATLTIVVTTTSVGGQ